MDYFMPRGNRYYRLFVGVRPQYRYAVTVFLCSVLTYGWFTLIYNRIEHRIMRYTTDVANNAKQLELAEQSQMDAEMLKKSVYDLREAVRDLRANHTCELPMPFMIEMIKEAGLTLQSCVTASEADKEWYAKTKLNLTLQGKMQNIISFFSKVQNAEKMVDCSEVSLSRAQDDLFAATCKVSFLQVK